MKNIFRHPTPVLVFILSFFLLSSFIGTEEPLPKVAKFPYKKAGLTERQAAAHLLSRFTFGAKPGQVEEVVKMGLEKWFALQLQANIADPALEQKLAPYRSLKMSNEQIVYSYPQKGQILKLGMQEGVFHLDSLKNSELTKEGRIAQREKLGAYMREKGFKNQGDLYQELIDQKIIRAAYSENQLQEILTSFWFNHFNVSLTNKNCDLYLVAYERDVIRPNVLGKFETILLATAKSPAMLAYLDNFKSVAATPSSTNSQKQKQQRQEQMLATLHAQDTTLQKMQQAQKIKTVRNKQGLNENYAREIMELHTLGVDGGYTQQDVTQAARILTGWTINPEMNYFNRKRAETKNSNQAEVLARQGIVQEGDFWFAANKHDQGPKEVLGTSFPAGGGYEEGLKLIKLLAHHPSTAKFISTKLAIRFVNDRPSQTLIDKMAKTFREKDGDIREVLLTMVAAPEFWGKEALREKTKSPFELAISSVRSLNAEVQEPKQLYTWITKMGEKMYYYQAPTGFPDKGTYWINTGSLLNRMNFGLALASQKIKGISFDLMSLNQNREPESAQAALLTYSQFLLPERNLEATIKRLTPTLNDPDFGKKVDAAANKKPALAQKEPQEQEDQMMMESGNKEARNVKKNPANTPASSLKGGNTPMLAQVVGIIIGSPEFQRR
ncbi:DUF1800 domain-containing protein [Rufibacter latericius]|uniref:DUF1800 domain-containing protein n=1 Tax=Rufibacter latericius TaxID=2487040 RepID=A0A3M9MN24_9BACT|nr:DUF1800 domain-containing protein [Rufibacter latericius]RNI26940.1 DUF1800 domain-containing protein [Rufibacter latericius]